MSYLEIASGLIILVFGAEFLVRGAVAIANRLNVSPLLIGLTLVGFGTSSPELVASVAAALKDSPGIAVGNVVGSNICNVFLILGASALIKPVATSRDAFFRDGSILVAASLLLVGVGLYGFLERVVGLVFLALLAAYVIYCYRTERLDGDPQAAVHAGEAALRPAAAGSLVRAVAASLVGLLALIVGAYLLVEGSIAVSRTLGIPETIIGLTVVAIGTSLPELATSMMAALRGQSDVAIGNVLGSNIYNMLGILGVTAVIKPIPIAPEIVAVDLWVMLAAVICLVAVAVSGWRVSRWEGGAFLVAYALYLGYLAQTAAGPAAS